MTDLIKRTVSGDILHNNVRKLLFGGVGMGVEDSLAFFMGPNCDYGVESRPSRSMPDID